MSRQDGSSRQVTTGPVDDSATPILHVDMDAFFVSVELLRRPELRGKPVLVGGTAGRGVVAAASYEARRYGVNSAMPMSVALQRCPNAVVLRGDYRRYAEYSDRVMTIFRELTPLVEPLSIDEAFLDVSGARRLHGSPAEIAWTIRRRVHDETGLTCSVGVAASKYVAKVASGRAKPDGMLVVPAAETTAFLHPLPVSALWGVGRVTEESLLKLGLRTVGDVAAMPLDALTRAVGPALAARLSRLANGIDPRDVETRRVEKSIGHETTFDHDLVAPDDIARELLRLAADVGVRLRKAGLVARTVTLKLRYGDFTTVTRSRTLAEPTDVARRIYEEALVPLGELVGDGRRVRLIGVRAEQLRDAGGGAPLWDPDEDWRDAERTIDEVTRRFGRGAVRPAALVRPGGPGLMPTAGAGWERDDADESGRSSERPRP
ncbi:DNA polymerase-4 [Agromyces flavus]|uniref:DNA polymerase IV n=1 Tax=Agromyces flavus TaxID=589382 RepID=A0A1H1Q8F8_9MICO|nr:DNA polymerase IV [Agromyces flavus]MCP2367782.1 DNA polymerase-4 [Agromyces flavus]GGI47242.1 DNA polymerase IV [Agromyces flavus]SDS19781.1 DNA polymerase-4 [Agromyces flavus]